MKIEKFFGFNKNIFEKNISEDFGFLKKKKFYSFHQTKLLPSYLFAFAAGNFECVENDNSKQNLFQMKLYCEKEKLKYVDHNKNSIFFFCEESIKFYENFFKIKSPFKKYDLVFCPDFLCNAMEYPGIISFHNRFLYENKISNLTKIRRAKTIVHEISHMWFGNYITMKWWDDLWLNESFADFVTFLCLDEMIKNDNIDFDNHDKINNNDEMIKNDKFDLKNYDKNIKYTDIKNNKNNFKNFKSKNKNSSYKNISIWAEFFLKKKYAYLIDIGSKSHPVYQEINKTDEVSDLFDSITYAKGAAVLKQLYFIIGKKKFCENINNYFNKYKWKNVELRHFIEEISRNIKFKKKNRFDINFFCEEFIKKSGVNKIEVIWNPEKNGKQIIKILQSSFQNKKNLNLRFHKLKFAFFINSEEFDEKEIWVENKEITFYEIDNKNYKAILPNFEDWGYIKILFDKFSIDFFFENLFKMKNNLNIIIILNTIFDMVCDKKISFKKIIPFLGNEKILLAFKNNLQVFQEIIRIYDNVVNRFFGRREKIFYHKLIDEKRRNILPLIKDKFVYKFFDEYYFEYLDA